VYTRVGASLPETETEPASETSLFFKKLDDGQSAKKENYVS
jgi:hypothetical protein